MSLLSEMVSPSPETGDQVDSSPSDFAKVRERLFGTRNKSPKTNRTKSSQKEIPGVTEEEVNKLFAGENWEEISALYFNTRFALTGWEGFLLSPDQKKVLGLSLSTSMRYLIKIDPGYLALLIFTTNFGGIIAQKEMTFQAAKKRMKKTGEDNGKKAS